MAYLVKSLVYTIPHDFPEREDNMLARFGLVVSPPLWKHSHLEVGAITRAFTVVVKEIHGVGCRFVSEDGVFTLAEFRNLHIILALGSR